MRPRFALLTHDRFQQARARSLFRPSLQETMAVNANDTVDQQIADLYNANNAVLSYQNAVVATDLPAVPQSPAWYNEFINGFSNVKTNALVWQNSITPRLSAIPQSIINYGTLFTLNVNNVNQFIDVLLNDPGNQGARKGLTDTLNLLHRNVGDQSATAVQLQRDIATYSTSLVTDADVLRAAVAQADIQIGDDRQKVQEISRIVDQIKADIATKNKIITAAGITAGVSVFIGAVGGVLTAAFGPLGLIVVGLGVIGFTAGIITIIVASVEIKRLQAELTAKTQQMDQLTQRANTLTQVQAQVNDLIELSSAAQTGVQTILDAWSLLTTDLSQVVDEIEKAEGDLDRNMLLEVRADINRAQEEWTSTVELARKFTAVQYTVDSKITPLQGVQQQAA